jgi:hypothetical protein
MGVKKKGGIREINKSGREMEGNNTLSLLGPVPGMVAITEAWGNVVVVKFTTVISGRFEARSLY